MANKVVLQLGDCISIYGLKIIYLDGKLAITSVNRQLTLNRQILPLHYVQDASEAMKDAGKKIREKSYFHRSPRNVAPLETDPIEIEAPPAPQKNKERPVLLVAGPAFTMAIPMVLGTLLAVYGSQSSGVSSGLYMLTGLILGRGECEIRRENLGGRRKEAF